MIRTCGLYAIEAEYLEAYGWNPRRRDTTSNIYEYVRGLN
jgi:hypothetical protein